jgi:hypothetical protein
MSIMMDFSGKFLINSFSPIKMAEEDMLIQLVVDAALFSNKDQVYFAY